MRIFFSVGEPSGDLHGANLIREIKRLEPSAVCEGYGGPRMAAAGFSLHADLTQLAVMWIARVLVNLHKFIGLLVRADRFFHANQLDAVVLIDYPGFNWWIARRAKAHGIPVFYYGAPQLWAWAPWRIRKMRRLTDLVLCKLPFEPSWFNQRGCNARYVGHPYFDELAQRQLDHSFVNEMTTKTGPLVTILPGSRTQEVVKNLRWLLRAAVRIKEQIPGVRFAVASFNSRQGNLAKRLTEELELPAECHADRTPELIRAADVCLACSGSVSLELLYDGKPSVILYWVDRVSYWLQSKLRQVRYITLANLLDMQDPGHLEVAPITQTEQEGLAMPEYLTYQDKSAEIAAHAVRWLSDPRAYEAQSRRLLELRDKYGRGGASIIAAQTIVNAISRQRPDIPRPHFIPEGLLPASSGEPSTPLSRS